MFRHLASARRASWIAAAILLLSAVTMRAGERGSGTRAETVSPRGDRQRTLPARRETGKFINLGDLLFEEDERIITVTEPNGGEEWEFGDTHRLEWESTGLVENVKITLWNENGGFIGVIATDLPPATTQYDWRVGFLDDGTWIGDAAPYFIQVREMGQPVSDHGDAPFDVTPGIVVLSPAGGETWAGTSTETISWAACGLTHEVKLNLYDDGDMAGTIVSSTPGETFDWIVGRLEDGSTVEPGPDYKVVVKENSVNLYDASDDDFTIEPGIDLLSPNGGERWVAGTTETISWAACGLAHDVKLNLYEGGNMAGTIVSSTPGETFDWTVGKLEDGSTVEPGPDYKVVVKENDVNRYDTSDGDFAIEPGGSPRRLFAMSTVDGTIYLGWRDSGVHGYNVYRIEEGVDDEYALVTPAPITASTNWVDTDVVIGRAYRYRVSETDANGAEGASSISVRCECVAVSSGEQYTYRKIVDESISGLVEALPMAGDVDGDGLSDFMVRTIDAAASEGRVRVYLDDPVGGTLGPDDVIHERILSCVEPQVTYICWTLWDMNGDGREDLVGIDYEGGFEAHIIDLANGTTTSSENFLPGAGTTTYRKSIAIADLRGDGPCLVYRAGTRYNENKWIVALSNGLEMIGQEEIPASADDSTPAFSHFIEVADIDADGRDEGILGSWIIECDGDGEFMPYAQWGYEHPDGIWVADVMPSATYPGQEIYMYVENSGGVFLFKGFEASTGCGDEIWRHLDTHTNGDDHADRGWVANVVENFPGMEAYVIYKPYSTSEVTFNSFLLKSDPYLSRYERPILHYEDFRHGPIDWNGLDDGETVEIVEGDAGGRIVKLSADGSSFSSVASGFLAGGKLVMDVVGDYREELVVSYVDESTSTLTVKIYTNNTPAASRAPSPCESRQYMQKRRWAGH